MPLKLRLITLLLRCLALTSLKTQRWIGQIAGSAVLRWNERSAQICRRNVALCYPELDEPAREDLCLRSLQQTGMAFSELASCYYWPAEKFSRRIDFSDRKVLDDAIAEGKGVILASPHFGCWELISQYLAIDYSLHILYRPAKDPHTDDYILNRRSRLGSTLLPTDASGVRGLSKALKKGEIIGILPDQEPDIEGGVFAPFFGQQTLTMTLLSKLARRKKTPVLLTSMRRTRHGFELQVSRLCDDIYAQDLHISTTALNAAVEALVRKNPEQYIWNYKRFSTQPEGMPRLY